MPGNEIEDRIRILYELNNYSLGQHHSQSVDDNRPVLVYDQWVEKQRQISEPVSFNLKNYTLQQSDSWRGHGNESFSVFDKNYGQLTQRSDLSSSQSINEELNANGFMLGQQNFKARQNHLEELGERTGFIPHNLVLKDLSAFKSHQENASGDSPTLTTNSERSEMTDASTEFNFIGGQQLVRGQQPDIPQPTSMQQSGCNDIHLLQQHIMLKKLQELQRQQQLQQFGDARQQNSVNQHSSITKQGSGIPPSALINGTPVNDAPQMFMNWVQRDASPAAQDISNRAFFTQEQGQTLRSMPLVPPQFDVSLYGTPIASARGMNHYSHAQGMSHDSPHLSNKISGQTQKPVIQSAAVSNPFISNQFTFSPEQECLPQGAFIPKHGLQGTNMFGKVPLQGLHSGATLGNSLLGNPLQANASLHELGGKQEPAGWSGLLQQKTMQQHDSSQELVSLDPMEEKILYNTDDDVWNASVSRRSDMVAGGFGNTLDQTDYSNAFPSIQSGSWSALMQSAVAEASSSDTGLQEEWSGLTFQNTELSIDNQTSNILDNEKQQRGWADNNLPSDSSLGSKPVLLNDSSVSSSFPGFHPTGIQFMTKQREDLHQDETRESIQKSPKDTSAWVDYNPQPTLHMEGNEQVQQLMHLDNTWAAGQINKISENTSHQQRIASYDIDSEPSSKPEGHTNEAMYKRRNSDVFSWKTVSDGGLTSFSRSTGGLTQLQSDVNNTLLSRENSQKSNFSAVSALQVAKAHQETSQQVTDGNQLGYMKQVRISMNSEENDIIGVKQYQMGNISNVMQNSYRAAETYGQQQNCYPRDNYCDSYHPEGLKGHKQGHLGQFKIMGDVSNNAISLDKGRLPNLQGDSRALEELSRGDLDKSATFRRSVGSGDPNIIAQTSQDMLELLPKVDHSKENVTVPHFGSTGFSPLHEVAEAGSARALTTQMYNQSLGSQGFALRLAPPSQRLANSNSLFLQSSPQASSNLNLRQGHSDLGERNQSQIAPSSTFQPLPVSNDLSSRDSWDEKFNNLERTDRSSSLYRHQSSIAAIPSNHPFSRNQLQMQLMSNGQVSCPSSQATLHGTASRCPPLNFAPSQDTSQQIRTKLSGQQLPGLEAVMSTQPPIMPSIPQQGGFSGGPQSLWNKQQHLSVMEPSKVHSINTSSNSMETTSLTQRERKDQNSQKAGYEPSELSACSINSQGSVLDEDQSRKEGPWKLISSGMVNALHTGARNISDKNALVSGSLLAQSPQQDLDRLQQNHNYSPTGSERSHESFGHSLKPSYGSHQNYSLLHQVQGMKNVETDQTRRVLDLQQLTATTGQQSAYEHNLRSRSPKDEGLNSAIHLSSLSSSETKMSSFTPEAREDLRIIASSQSALQDIPSQGLVAFRQNDFRQPSGSNVASDRVEKSLANVNMVPSWFKQFGTLRNGQIPPTYEPKLAGNAGVQFSLMKPSQTFDIHSSVEQLDVADAIKSSIDQSVITTIPKKRKTLASECLPWHKMVTQSSQKFKDISVAEQDWAQTSNRLIEKVEDGVEMIEDGLPLLRRKRRLILTTQLMQQLLCPAPAPVLTENAALHYDGVVFFVARSSLGDACSLTYGNRNDLYKPLINCIMISEDLKVSESIEAQLSKAVEDFTSRSKKLETDLLRLDKAASILDLRVECQELEKVSVINRFAKFHVRPAGVSGTTSSSGTATPKICPQRYITALPMPENVPEGVQCLSL